MMKRWGQHAFLYIAAVFCLTSLSGCKRSSGPLDENCLYQVYYANTSMTRLVAQPYQAQQEDPDKLVEELMDRLANVPKDLECQPVLTDKIQFLTHKREDMVLYLYFDSGYSGMGPIQEILCRAALAKTLTQIDGIEYINIYAGDQPIVDADGNPVGMLGGSDFVDSVSDVNSFEKIELTLYFTDETGQVLVPEHREVVHGSNVSLEKLVVEQLIEGPEQPGLYPTLPPGVRLINVSVSENVCYLNFDSSFSDNALEINEYIPIYSIVNSLVELSTVTRVQFTINGSQDVMFRERVSLNAPFERNLDLQEGMED